jgi:hypothetical protein
MPISCDPPVAVNDTRTVPFLAVFALFDATENAAVPVPVPDVVPEPVMKPESDDADQPQVGPVVTVTLSVPPAWVKFVVFVETEYEHGATPAAWLKSNVAPPPCVPASVSRALRAGPVFDATE